MKITLVRHGQSVWNLDHILWWHEDFELTDLWIQQARDLWKVIWETNYDLALSSDLIRTRKTLELIISKNNVANKNENKLLREIYLWEREWRKMSDVAKELWLGLNQGVYRNIIGTLGGESKDELYQRWILFYEEVLKDSLFENLLTVSHSFFLTYLVSHLLHKERDTYRFWNCGYMTIELNKTIPWKILEYNWITIN